MRKILPLMLLACLCGCAAKTDLSQLGAGVGATWRDGPKVGVDAGLGKHELEVKPLFTPAGDAAEGAPGQPAPVEPAPRNRFAGN